MKIARKFSLQVQKSESIYLNTQNFQNFDFNPKPILLDTGRKFETTKSLFPNKPSTISFLKGKFE